MDVLRVGVDAGGSRAEAVVVDDQGRERARIHGACRVLEPGAVGEAAEAVGVVVRHALEEAGGAPPARILRVGWAGAGRDAVRFEAERALRAAGLADEVRVDTDVDLAFESAFGDGPGLLVIAGTGSVALGRGAEGGPAGRARVRVGGWGARLGDEGSGYWIALQALGCVARAEDGRAQRTALRDVLLGRLGLSDPRDLIGWVGSAGKREVAALAPLVLDVAGAGDPVAASIGTDAAAALRSHVIALLEQLDPDGPLPLVLWGGLIAEGGPLRPVLEHLLGPLGLALQGGRIDPAGTAAGVVRQNDTAGRGAASI